MVGMLALAAVSGALAAPAENVTYGEMYGHFEGWTGNAYTTDKGTVALHPFLRSSVGVTDFMDIKASILGEIGTPHLSVEVAPLQNERLAASLETRYGTGWGFRHHDISTIGHFSVVTGPKVMLDASLGAHMQYGTLVSTDLGGNEIEVEGAGFHTLRPELSGTFRLGDPTHLVVTARTNALTWDQQGANGAIGTYLVWGYESFALSGGMNLRLFGTKAAEESLSLAFGQDINLPAAIPVPLPHFQMWFRI